MAAQSLRPVTKVMHVLGARLSIARRAEREKPAEPQLSALAFGEVYLTAWLALQARARASRIEWHRWTATAPRDPAVAAVGLESREGMAPISRPLVPTAPPGLPPRLRRPQPGPLASAARSGGEAGKQEP